MTQFIAAQIDLLERQVNQIATSAQGETREVLCEGVEELMSIYLSLFQDVDRAVAKIPARIRWNAGEMGQWLPCYRHLARIGAMIRDLIRPLKAAGFEICGLHEFMTTFVAARASAATPEIMADFAALDAGTLKTRPLEETVNDGQSYLR